MTQSLGSSLSFQVILWLGCFRRSLAHHSSLFSDHKAAGLSTKRIGNRQSLLNVSGLKDRAYFARFFLSAVVG